MLTNTRYRMRFILLFLAVATIIAVWYYDVSSYLTLDNFEYYRQDFGWWAPVAFILAFVIGELLQVPSVLWIFLAGMIWPWWIALPLSLAGAVLAATGAFLMARYFLGDRMPEKLPPAFLGLNERLRQRPISAIVFVRLTTFLHPVMHWVLAASSARLPAFIIGTSIGVIPMTLALILLGEVFMSWWDNYSLLIMGAAAAAIVVYAIVQRRKRIAPV